MNKRVRCKTRAAHTDRGSMHREVVLSGRDKHQQHPRTFFLVYLSLQAPCLQGIAKILWQLICIQLRCGKHKSWCTLATTANIGIEGQHPLGTEGAGSLKAF
jgi:hypothetical protein